jgi:pimeloyl-ACP methyl ester carboxylesterase/lysophospholipase L1-like esterase
MLRGWKPRLRSRPTAMIFRPISLFVVVLAFIAGNSVAFSQQSKKKSGSAKTQPKGATAAPSSPLPAAKRIVFLGDSITASGQYIEFLETILLAETDKRYEVLDLGLSSETVSGLSEPNHANGQFPRPDLHERLERVLAKTKPDLVIACYGMNCGIYHPYSDARFDKFAAGMEKLRKACAAHGAKIIHLTPPVFDPVPIKAKTLPAGLESYEKPFEGYNRVLDTYADRLVYQKNKSGWNVIDIHTPMKHALEEGRKADPDFVFAKDGVHPNADGHWVMTHAILDAWNVKHDYKLTDFTTPEGRLSALYKLVADRQRVLKAAWLSECGHKRPGVKAGLPIPEAQAKAADITTQINAMLEQGKSAFANPKVEVKPAVVPPNPTPSAVPPSTSSTTDPGKPALFPGKRSDWHGFDRYEFDWNGKTASIVAPKEAASGKPWVWHGEFFGHKPDPDIALLGKGFHIVYLRVPDTLGAPSTVKTWTEFYNHLVKEYKFSKKPSLVGLSRGGLYCYNWAIANPDKVSCIYGDAPVCDFKSWPGGKGKGKGDPKNWARVLELWGFKTDEEAIAAKVNPVDNLAPLAKRHVPLLHVFGDKDDVVPADENTLLLAERYRKLDGTIELIAKAGVGHHPHGLEDSTPIVNFIVKYAK